MKRITMPLLFLLFATASILSLPKANASAAPVLNAAPSDSQAAKLKETRADFKAVRDHLARVRRAVKERFAELKTRDIRAARLQHHLNKETARLGLKIIEKAPSIFRHDVQSVLDPKEVKEVLSMVDKTGSLLKEFNELTELQASAADPTRASAMAKVEKEIGDLTNEIAILDAFVSGLDKKISDLDHIAVNSSPAPSAPPQASSGQLMTKNARDEAPPRAGDHTFSGSNGSGGASGGAQGGGSGSGGGSSGHEEGWVVIHDPSTGTRTDQGPVGHVDGHDSDHDTESNDDDPPL